MALICKITRKIRAYGTLVMFKHTIFSLSFGLVSLFLATNGSFPPIYKGFLILIALLSARTGANAINRVIDRHIDAQNPRTATRQLPKGEMTATEASIFATVNFILMVVCAWLINPLCGLLSPVALLFMILYSYTKRYTWLCHIILGITCAIAPIGAWFAITGNFGGLTDVFTTFSTGNFYESWSRLIHVFRYDSDIFIPMALFVANATWVAGFDIIYATQDFKHDQAHNICSIPARFGLKIALHISTFLHLVAIISLFITGYLATSLGVLYFTGLIIIAGLLVYEHAIVKPTNLSRATIASYSINEIIGLIFLMVSLTDILIF